MTEKISFSYLLELDSIIEFNLIKNYTSIYQLSYDLLEQYLELLDFYGWSRVRYEQELIKIIDNEWIVLHNRLYG